MNGAGTIRVNDTMQAAGDVHQRLLDICKDLVKKNKVIKLDKLYKIARREIRCDAGTILAAMERLEDDLVIKSDSRLMRADLLHNETRREVFFTIRRVPGISFNQLRERTGKGTKILLWHVNVLLDFGCIVERSFDGRSKAYFTYHLHDEGMPEEVYVVLALCQNDTMKAIIDSLLAASARTPATIESTTGFSRQLVDYHLKKLRATGIVVDALDGGIVMHAPFRDACIAARRFRGG